MGCEAMAQRVTAGGLIDTGLTERFLHRALETLLTDRVPPLLARTRVQRTLRGGKYILPAPFPSRPGIFARQGQGQVDLTKALPQILLMQGLHPLQVGLKRCDKGAG